MDYTVIGASGFIGSEIVAYLERNQISIYTPSRYDQDIFSRELGIVIYCAGNGDCSGEPFNVNSANVIFLSEILTKASFKKLIYLSSTRIYMNSVGSHESSDIIISDDDERRLFNLTKLVAEELCLKSNKDCVIVRPSNVYGKAFASKLFLPSIIRDAIYKGIVNMYVSPDYNKDYISVDDVINAIMYVSKNKVKYNIYNVASGKNTSASDIALVLKDKTGCEIIWHDCISKEQFPIIDIQRLCSEMIFSPRDVLQDMSEMIDNFKTIKNS